MDTAIVIKPGHFAKLAVEHLNAAGDTPSWLAISASVRSRVDVRWKVSATVIHANLGLSAWVMNVSIAFKVAM